jgi:dihydroorotase
MRDTGVSIVNGRVVDPATGQDAIGSVHVRDGQIVSLGEAPQDMTSARVIDARGKIVAPGIVDLSVRLSGDMDAELAAATKAGVTTLVCPPDIHPILDAPGLVDTLIQRTAGRANCRVLPLGALTVALAGERLSAMGALASAGCIGFYQGLQPIVDTRVTLNALQYAATLGYTVWLTPREPWLARETLAHDGEVATRLGLAAVPKVAEAIALGAILRLVEWTGCKVHVARVYTAQALELLAAARQRGLPVTADTAIHHLHCTDFDIGYFDTACKVQPPFGSGRDRDALANAVAAGVLDAITSDHTPQADDAKLVPFAEAAEGVTAVELLLPLTLKWGRSLGLSLVETLAPITSRPAALIGQEARMAVGERADLMVFDAEASWNVQRASLVSASKSTPMLGHEMIGRVTHTLVGGVVVEP